MKAKGMTLYASIALNAALLVLVAWPRTNDNTAFGQFGQITGSFAAVSTKGGGNQDVMFLAERASGALLAYQYQLGANVDPIILVGARNLKIDLDQRQLGNIMLVPCNVSDSRGVVFVIDTDSQRSAVYEYIRSDRAVNGIQRIDLRADIQRAVAAPSTDGGGPAD